MFAVRRFAVGVAKATRGGTAKAFTNNVRLALPRHCGVTIPSRGKATLTEVLATVSIFEL